MRIRMHSVLGALALAAISLGTLAAPRPDFSTVFQSDEGRFDDNVRRSGFDRSLGNGPGELGILLTSYDRVPLYEAYRVLNLDDATRAQQAQAEEGHASPYSQPKDPNAALAAWFAAREPLGAPPASSKLDVYRRFPDSLYGSYVNCGVGAFELAAETAGAIRTKFHLNAAQAKAWGEAQELVFAHCPDPTPGSTPDIPKELARSEPLVARQLRDYQIASAYFYDGRLDEARTRFEAIARQRDNPRRAWAAHAVIRALMRAATLDGTFAKAAAAARASATDPEQLRQAIQPLAHAERDRRKAAYAEIAQRANALINDPAMADARAATVTLLQRAQYELAGDVAFSALTADLGRFQADPDRDRKLQQWDFVGDYRLGPWAGGEQDISLRGQFEFFDWIRTVQGCTDNERSPNALGQCATEAAHARAKYQESKSRVWLVATLMTARSLTPELDGALSAALATPDSQPEYLTLRYNAVRLMRQAGKTADARTALAAVKVNTSSGSSAFNLIEQQRLLLADSKADRLKHLLRYHAGGPYFAAGSVFGYDADEAVNRRLSSSDLLRLAQDPDVPPNLRPQFAVAAWWRGEMVGNSNVAESAAKLVSAALPDSKRITDGYLKATDLFQRQYALAAFFLTTQSSPMVGAVTDSIFGKARRGPAAAANWWCSLEPDERPEAARIERIEAVPSLDANAEEARAERAKLAQIGSSQDWLARVAIRTAQQPNGAQAARQMLTVVQNTDRSFDCETPYRAALVDAARQAQASLPAAAH